MKNQPVVILQVPKRTVNFARILVGKDATLVQPNSSQQTATAQLARLPVTVKQTALRLARPRPVPANLKPLQQNRLSVPRVQGAMSRLLGASHVEDIGMTEITLPLGMPRSVNAATLKRMLKAKQSDVLLKRADDRWEIVANSTRIDLLDDSIEFRLGSIQIFS